LTLSYYKKKNPNYVVSWIGRVSDEVTSTLSKWGFSPNDPNNKNKLRVVVHSLGSILSGEISQRYGRGILGWQKNNGRLFTNNQYPAYLGTTQQQGAGVVNQIKVI
jgi:hypothetical protein